jgi:hypothetical protein
MILWQTAVAAGSVPYIEWGVKGILGAIGTAYLSLQIWQLRTTLKIYNKVERLYLIVCGDPYVKDDPGVVGDLKAHGVLLVNHEQRLHDIETELDRRTEG